MDSRLDSRFIDTPKGKALVPTEDGARRNLLGNFLNHVAFEHGTNRFAKD